MIEFRRGTDAHVPAIMLLMAERYRADAKVVLHRVRADQGRGLGGRHGFSDHDRRLMTRRPQ